MMVQESRLSIAQGVWQIERTVNLFTRSGADEVLKSAVFKMRTAFRAQLADILGIAERQLDMLTEEQSFDRQVEAERFMAAFMTMLGVIDSEIFGDLFIDLEELIDSGDPDAAVSGG